MKLDILVFAVHPDDAELGCSGTILKHIAAGKKVGIVDLTRGELGTRGTAETRDEESAESTRILGLHVRENLEMRDGFFKNDEQHQLKVIQMIRKYTPEVVLCNALHDRHPDHGRASDLVYDALFLSGLAKIETQYEGKSQKAFRPRLLLQFIQDRYIQPDILVDVTEFWDKKLECIHAFKTQFFNPDNDDKQTYISSPEFLKVIEARSRELGKSIGAVHAEGFTSKKLLGVNNLFDLR
ncbi:bacillithiol biosynthesis deacetylase BshB1 [Daejeonella lutea]|uniref:Bacillithiol biosynthesis deacetylase BshB1 n=1 Tax=Daejeonella lutea TaxID=572036 RepID=A0A1T5A213_9SPHI|nr:bacillithiol biosynthesis deacetylase BshB1 [Daejeonella lutea]SKB29061.1 bacillithiol biosynthesis deacetylase BshB1 [Daejeonella lutea]